MATPKAAWPSRQPLSPILWPHGSFAGIHPRMFKLVSDDVLSMSEPCIAAVHECTSSNDDEDRSESTSPLQPFRRLFPENKPQQERDSKHAKYRRNGCHACAHSPCLSFSASMISGRVEQLFTLTKLEVVYSSPVDHNTVLSVWMMSENRLLLWPGYCILCLQRCSWHSGGRVAQASSLWTMLVSESLVARTLEGRWHCSNLGYVPLPGAMTGQRGLGGAYSPPRYLHNS